jgi:hypothetical protein
VLVGKETVVNRKLTAVTSILAGILLALGAVPAGAQLVFERLALVPARVETGEGTVRLDGMGGFETAVVDENHELDLYDFSRNPAGYGDDRDSWTIDLRYSHQELLERDALLSGNDVRLNSGAFLLGYHAPGKLGVGGKINFAQVQARDASTDRQKYDVVGLNLTISKYLFRWLAAGVEITQDDEGQAVFSRRIYNISHDSKVVRGGAGIGLHVIRGVTLGARGQVVSNTIDGSSRSTFHTDTFDWTRPGGLWSLHGAVNRGRLHGALDYTRQDVEGEETVDISWSERFIYNPIDVDYTANATTFTEDRTDKELRTRWRLEVVPRRVNVSFAYLKGDGNFTVVSNPNALGSLDPGTVTSSSHAAIAGGSVIILERRLLLAGEVKTASSEVAFMNRDESTLSERDVFVVRGGGEYLLGETLVGRLGMNQTSESFTVDGAKSDRFASTGVAVGLGFLPAGAIWQLDLAYDVTVASDLETDWSRFSAYVKYLF